jgi:enterochelin esterase-like enzyme
MRKRIKIFFCLILFLIFSSEILSQMKTEQPNISGTFFQDYFNKINNSDSNKKKQTLADELMSQLNKTNYPIFENDSTVVLLYKGNVEKVGIIGDMTDWVDLVPFIKIEGTDLFYYCASFEPTARLEYWLMFSKDGYPFTDSLNRYKSLNGLGELSELAMPGYVRHPFFKEYEEGKKGDYSRVQEMTVPVGVLPYEHTIHVYLPPDYNKKIKYPVVYFQDGRDYIEYAEVPLVLDELINQKKITPVIAIFVTPPNLHQPKVPNRMTEYGMNDDYVQFFVDELVPFIDSKYSTQVKPGGRLVVGDSFGGLISIYIPFKHPEIFKMGYSQSGYHSFNDDKLIKLIDSSEKKEIKLFVDVGTYEKKVGATFLPENETNFSEGNRRLRKVLKEKGYDFIYKEYYEGHTWGNWRRHLIDALIYFFGNSK